MGVILSFDEVSFSYGRTPVLDTIRFDVNEGESIALVGPNGSGKTTLIRLAVGLLKPTSGTIRLLGESPGAARHHIAYLPQMLHFDPTFPVSVEEVVSMGRRGGFFGRLDDEDRASVSLAMERMDVAACAKEPFGNLSGGLRQRTLIARALVHPWRLLILDEPYSNVDEKTTSTISDLLTNIDEDQAIIFITHDTDTADSRISRVFCLNNRVVEHRTRPTVGDKSRRIVHE